MKKIIFIGVALAFTCSPVSAGQEKENYCQKVSGLAEAIISARHLGVSMQDLISTNKDDPRAKDMKEIMIIEAFEQPRMNTDEMKKRSIEEFRDKWYLECYKSVRNIKIKN